MRVNTCFIFKLLIHTPTFRSLTHVREIMNHLLHEQVGYIQAINIKFKPESSFYKTY